MGLRGLGAEAALAAAGVGSGDRVAFDRSLERVVPGLSSAGLAAGPGALAASAICLGPEYVRWPTAAA